jgi:hypothetical protein
MASGERMTVGSTWRTVKRLPELGFPQSFPLVQFPNVPLAVALVADMAAGATEGSVHTYAVSLSYLGISIWAYEELAHGVNWARRLLGAVFVVVMVVRVAHLLRS